MDRVWDKLDGYTKSDHLESSDEADDIQEAIRRPRNLSTSTENSLPSEVDVECSSGDPTVKVNGNLHSNLLDEMRESKLHCNTESRNVQEKIDDISAEKRRQRQELSEMHHKAQVISKSARMSATDVLTTIASSETMYMEENSEMEGYLNKIRSVQIDSSSTEQPVAPENNREPASSSSDIDLPEIPAGSPAFLNTGVMKSKANVARQGSMKARRKPTSRKSWTPGHDQLNLREEEETTSNTEKTGESDIWVLPKTEGNGESVDDSLQNAGLCTPSDSSSEDEKEVSKPHLRSGVALPGLWDAVRVKLQKSELKRPTALNLAKNAKDAKENEVTKEDKTEVPSVKPDWMKEVELRKKNPKQVRRKHMTLPGRCSELEKLFEQRKNSREMEGEPVDAGQSYQDEGTIAKETPRPKSVHNDDVDPELSRLLERRRHLKPMEGVSADGEIKPRPKSLHLEDSKCSELDKIFEKRRNVTAVEEARTGEPNTVSTRPRNIQEDDRQDSGIVHARFHDAHTKLEPLPYTGKVKVATITEVKETKVRRGEPSTSQPTARQSRSGQQTVAHVGEVAQTGQVAQFVFDGKGGSRATVGRIPAADNQTTSGQGHSAGQPTQVGHVAQFVFDGKGGSRATVGRIPPSGAPRPASQQDQNVNQRPTVSRYESQSREDHARNEMWSERNADWTEDYTPGQCRQSSGKDTRSFIEQLSAKPSSGYRQSTSQGKSNGNRRVRSRDNSAERSDYVSVGTVEFGRPLHSKPTLYPNNDRSHFTNTSSHDHPRPLPITEIPPPQSRPKPQLPKPHDTLPPLTADRGYPHSTVISSVSNTPEGNYTQSIRNSRQMPKEGLQKRTSQEKYTVCAEPDRLRKAASPVESPASYYGRKSDSVVTIEKREMGSRMFDTGSDRVRSPCGSRLSAGPELNFDKRDAKHGKPVTVTVKSIGESSVRSQVRENGLPGVRGDEFLPRVVNGHVSGRNDGRTNPSKQKSDPQGSQSTASSLPKWKQELREKKRLQKERQGEMLNISNKTSHDQDKIKQEQSESNIAEWQKRLKGIRKTWNVENSETVKDTNDNLKGNSSDHESDGEKEVPDFLKEFKEKKLKQKVKVTVTAKSTPTHQDTERTSVEEDHRSSSKHELGTYV